MVCRFVVIVFLFVAAIRPTSAAAETNSVVVCSQNLNNFPSDNLTKFEQQQRALVERILTAQCDVIAVQEVRGRSIDESIKNLNILGRAASIASGKLFKAYVGETNDRRIRNGFLVNEHQLVVRFTKSFAKEPVPSLQLLGPVRHFTRGPFMIFVKFKNADVLTAPGLLLTSVHFKSKADGWKDVTKTNYEFLRMEMAEATRELVLREKASLQTNTTALILGDLNSDSDSATAEILSGKVTLTDFSGANPCELDLLLRPNCKSEIERELQFAPLVYRESKHNEKVTGSYRYRGKLSIIDEIFIDVQSLRNVEKKAGALRVGVTGTFGKGSDHKLIWAEIKH